MTLSAANLTIANGSTGSTKVTVTPTGGYNGRIVWSLAATASSNPSSNLTACYAIPPVLVNGVSTANLTIGIGTACQSTAPASGAALRMLSQRTLPNGKSQAGNSTTTTGVCACVLICGCLVGGRRKWRLSLLLVVILFLPLASATLIGCGGGGSNSTNPPVTTSKATTYTLTLTGTDSVNGAIAASTTFTLTVD
jgi:type IV secretory pathway VirB2 component (pilin)